MIDIISYQAIQAYPTYADRFMVYMRPVLPVRFIGLSKAFSTVALVDTGSAETLIPMAFWDEIDPAHIPGEEGDLLAANGSSIRIRYATVDLAIRLGNTICRWRAVVGFTDARHEMILGDAGFLRYFAVTCDRPKQILTVRRSGDLPSPIMPTTTGPLARQPRRSRGKRGSWRCQHP